VDPQCAARSYLTGIKVQHEWFTTPQLVHRNDPQVREDPVF
jgi:hypothetical protein